MGAKNIKLRGIYRVIFVVLIMGTILALGGCGGGESGSGLFYQDGDNIVLTWQPPTENADGSPLNDLAGYRVHYGNVSGVYTNVINVANINTCSVGDLPLGQTVYFAVTAYDTSGNESGYSNEISTVISGI